MNYQRVNLMSQIDDSVSSILSSNDYRKLTRKEREKFKRGNYLNHTKLYIYSDSYIISNHSDYNNRETYYIVYDVNGKQLLNIYNSWVSVPPHSPFSKIDINIENMEEFFEIVLSHDINCTYSTFMNLKNLLYKFNKMFYGN